MSRDNSKGASGWELGIERKEGVAVKGGKQSVGSWVAILKSTHNPVDFRIYSCDREAHFSLVLVLILHTSKETNRPSTEVIAIACRLLLIKRNTQIKPFVSEKVEASS